MSRYIATRAIRGANEIVHEAEVMLTRAIEEKGADTPVAFPNTAYFLPFIFGMTGKEISTIGEMQPILEHAKGLLHPVPPDRRWTPYLGETLDSGMATLMAEEIIMALRFVYNLQPEILPGLVLAGGTDYGGNGKGPGEDGHCNGPIDDIQLRSWGIQLVDGRMPGAAAIVGAAKSNEVAVKLIRELQRRNILTLLCGNVNGRSIIHQLMEEGVELGYHTYTVPFGTDTISAIYALGFATRSALTFGGMKGGQARDILLYNKERVFAFVLALGEVDDLKYATAAGAINFGFPVIADTIIPEILPTGVTTYEHVISMPFNEIEGADDLERAEKLIQKCIEIRGVKAKSSAKPTCASSSAGSTAGLSNTCAWSTWKKSTTARSKSSALELIPSMTKAPSTWVSWSKWQAARWRRTSSQCLNARSITSSMALRASSTSASATSPGFD
jgi:acetyl-CoA synthase